MPPQVNTLRGHDTHVGETSVSKLYDSECSNLQDHHYGKADLQATSTSSPPSFSLSLFVGLQSVGPKCDVHQISH